MFFVKQICLFTNRIVRTNHRTEKKQRAQNRQKTVFLTNWLEMQTYINSH